MDIDVRIDKNNYISLVDIARKKNPKDPKYVIRNWLRNRMTLEFLSLWEKIYNPSFKVTESDHFKINAGLNSFSPSFSDWIEKTSAIGLTTSSGKYGGTYAHREIAIEFASWVSVEFRLYLVKEFDRLKTLEKSREWNLSRALTKINYEIHNSTIKEHLIPLTLTKEQKRQIYSSEADVLNVALFGKTAQEWKKQNKGKKGNMRDYANVNQLICLSNLESLNAVMINDGKEQQERLITLNQTAISQMKILVKSAEVKIIWR